MVRRRGGPGGVSNTARSLRGKFDAAPTVCVGSAANLRLHFGRVVGTSPTAYRKAFKQRATDDVQPGALGLRVS